MLRTHGCQQLQRKGKAELALIDAVDEHLHVHGRALALQATGQLLVGQATALPKVLDDGLGTRLVKQARFHAGSYMVFDLRAWYFERFSSACRKWNSMYA